MKSATAIGVAMLVVSVVATILPGAGGITRAATTTMVTVQDNQFNAASVTINIGDTVQWNWTGSSPHSVTADNASFDDPAGSFKASGTFSHTFNTPGAFAYYCRVHGAPGGGGMSGTVVVQAAAAADTPTSTPAATGTALATSTPAPATPTAALTQTPGPTNTPASSTPVAVTPTIDGTPAATRAAGAAAAGAQLPRTGSGGSGGASPSWPSVALAVFGFVALGAALAARRRA